MVKTNLFDFYLPKNLIVQKPLIPADNSRLMFLDRKNQKISHFYFYQIDQLLKKEDILVFNDTKVIPARLYGKKAAAKLKFY